MQDDTQSPQIGSVTPQRSNEALPTRIETEHHVIHLEPRMSAPKLAEYLVSDAARQETIVKQAKRGPKAIMIPYTRVRNTFGEALKNGSLDSGLLNARADEIGKLESLNTWQQDDNVRCAEALRLLAELAPKIQCSNGKKIHRPNDAWPALKISGVRVSVQPELVFSCEHRGVKKVGAIILNTGKSESLSLAHSNGRYTAGDYLTVLVYQMLDSRLKDWGVPLHTNCLAIDVFRRQTYSAPAAFKTLLRHIEAACRTIALQWDALEIGADEELTDA
jgi:hypothetical protein